MTGSISPAALFRAIEDEGVSLMIDEADRLFKHFNSDMIAILNSGIDRLTAYAMRTVPSGERDYKARYFSTFTGIAFTSIGPLPITEQQDRIIALPFNRAKKTERPEQLDIETRQGLIDIGRKLARWAADLPELPKIGRSVHMHNRIEDKWRTLFQIAKLASGEWFERCGHAAGIFRKREEINDASGGGAMNADLLADVWQVFYDLKRTELHTRELCNALNAMDEAPWSTASNGRPITGYFLRDNLGGFLAENPEKIAPRKFVVGGVRSHGYHEKHFKNAFELYLDKKLPSEIDTTKSSNSGDPSPQVDVKNSKTSGDPAKNLENDDESIDYQSPDDAKTIQPGPDGDPAKADNSNCPDDDPAASRFETGHPASQKRDQCQQDSGKMAGSPDDFAFKRPPGERTSPDVASGDEHNLYNFKTGARGRGKRKP
jgi:hypothetical protein